LYQKSAAQGADLYQLYQSRIVNCDTGSAKQLGLRMVFNAASLADSKAISGSVW